MKKPKTTLKRDPLEGDYTHVDEFFTRTVKRVSKAEFDRLNHPDANKHELLKLLNSWYDNARRILKKYGFNVEPGEAIPELCRGSFLVRGTAAYDDTFKGVEREAQFAYDVIVEACKVRRLLEQDDKSALALAAIALGTEAMRADLPKFSTKARSKGGTKAVQARHERNLPPLPTLRALRRECDRVRQTLHKENGKEPRLKTVHRKVSTLLFGDDRYYRRIENALKKIPPE
jgi:hypothetical protein